MTLQSTEDLARNYIKEVCERHAITGIDLVSEYNGTVITAFAHYDGDESIADPILPKEVTSEALFYLFRLAKYLPENLDHGEIVRFDVSTKTAEIVLSDAFGTPYTRRKSVAYI